MRRWFSAGVLVFTGLSVTADAAQSSLALASKILTGTPDANQETTVTGTAGAIEPRAQFILMSLDTGHWTSGRAASDGSFSAKVLAPYGTSILIKSDPDATQPLTNQGLIGLHGTIVTVSAPPAESGIPFAGAGVDPALNAAVWRIEGSIPKQQFAPGEVMVVRGTYRLRAPEQGAVDPRANFGVNMELLADADGRPATAYAIFDSSIMTPTGLPIERFPYFGESSHSSSAFVREGAWWRADFTAELRIPADRRAGWYLPRLQFGASGVSAPPTDPAEKRERVVSQSRGLAAKLRLPPIRVGSPAPPRIPAVLFLGDLVEGTRGAVAVQDRDRYAPANHIVTGSDVVVIPRTRRYRLDPFLTTIGVGDRGNPPSPPLLGLEFPSGSLAVTIRAPSGSTRTLGPAPFRQWNLFGPADQRGHSLEGGPHISDAFELSTLDSAFEVAFEEDGLHTIDVDGSIEDLQGNVWRVGGTYEVHLARPLIIDPAVLPGTPFEVGNDASLSLRVIPPMPAEVEVRVRVIPSGVERSPHSGDASTSLGMTRNMRGEANRFGELTLPSIAFDEPGEFRIDIVARHRDADGTLRVGSMTWGSVVAERNPPIVAHGRRGIDRQPGEKQQWFFRSQTGDPIGDDHLQFPFHAGDVAWLQESDSAIPIITVQDLQGATGATINALWNATHPQLDSNPAGRTANGELPLISGNLDGSEAHLEPENVDVWAYSYRAVERPLVRVREQIGEDPAEAYWRFNDRYHLQSGNGANGDLPNDFKFQFGGAVLRGKRFDPPLYAIYGSLFVLVAEDDAEGGSRVFPPFQGNGGGPSGGPLFKLKGKEVDLFFHPTGVRPGTILHRGERASFAGYSAPPLPSKIEIVITSPSGGTRTIAGQANKVGYFFDPGFTVAEAGVWKAKVKIVFDGRTSAGQVTAPFPSGNVLGSREGEFYFYVVDADAPPLELAPMPQFVQPADGAVTFIVKPPAGLSNVQLTRTTSMPGFILEEATTTSMTYRYDATKLAKDFPNLDLHDADGNAGADTITISFLLSGTAAGAKKHFARQVVIQGQELQMPAQNARPKRRAVR